MCTKKFIFEKLFCYENVLTKCFASRLSSPYDFYCSDGRGIISHGQLVNILEMDIN